jgi:hypothetical protein
MTLHPLKIFLRIFIAFQIETENESLRTRLAKRADKVIGSDGDDEAPPAKRRRMAK